MSQAKDISDYFHTRSSVANVSNLSKSAIKSSTLASQRLEIEKDETPVKRSFSSISSSQIDETSTPSKRTRSGRKCSAKTLTVSAKKSKLKTSSKISFGNAKDNSLELFDSLSKSGTCVPISSETSLKIAEKQIEKKETLLNSEQIREKLKNCKNISQLRQNLSAINGCAEKLKQFKEIKVHLSPVKQSFTKSPQKFRTPEKLSISGLSVIPSPLQVCKSPQKPSQNKVSNLINPSSLPRLSCNRRLFADDSEPSIYSSHSNKDLNAKVSPPYKRFNHLLNLKDPDESSLPLPMKYRELVTLFDRMDFLVDRCQTHHERCTLDKLAKSIEATTEKKFDLNVLQKILSVGQSDQWFKLSYDIVDGACKLIIEANDKRRDTLDIITLHTTRVGEFNDYLLNITKEKHLQFLTRMNLQISPKDRIYRWHPMFKLEEDVPDITINEDVLPKNFIPLTHPSSRLNSILNYFPKRSETILDNKNDIQNENAKDNPTKTIKKGVLKGVSQDLLNKIRAKEAASKKRLMLQNPKVTQEITLLQNVPEVIRIIHSIFIESNSVQTIPYVTLCTKLCDSFHSSFSFKQADFHLQYLLNSDFAKNWIETIELNRQKYIKINREYQLKDLFSSVNSRISALRMT